MLLHSPIAIDLALLGYGTYNPTPKLMQFYDIKSNDEFRKSYDHIINLISGPDITLNSTLYTDKPIVASKCYNIIPRIDNSSNEIIKTEMSFKDDWVDKFNVKKTTSREFTRDDSTVTNIQMMEDRRDYLVYQDKTNIVVRKDFKNGAYAEFIIGDPNCAYTYSIREIILRVPKFTAESKGDAKIFLPKFILNDDIRQETMLKIDEAGAEAHSAVSIYLNYSSQPLNIIEFNQTFHYRIIKNGMIVIRGTFNG